MGDDSEHPKATPFIVKLHNNGLEDVSCLDTVLSEICDLSKVTTLDLSFNKISTIEGAFDAFPSLKRLYLHGNKELNSFAEVLHLQVDCPSVRGVAYCCGSKESHMNIHTHPHSSHICLCMGRAFARSPTTATSSSLLSRGSRASISQQ